MTWTRETIEAELVKLFSEFADSGVQISEGSDLVGDLGIDSLGVMELIQNIEDKFAIHIPDEALTEVQTVGDVTRAIIARLEADGRLG
jgi:acyl carrier protein